MPHVDVTVIGKAPTQEQKDALFSRISNLLVTVLGRPRKLTLVSVRTEPAAAWSVGGNETEDGDLVGVEAVIRAVAGNSSEDRARMIGETTTVLREMPSSAANTRVEGRRAPAPTLPSTSARRSAVASWRESGTGERRSSAVVHSAAPMERAPLEDAAGDIVNSRYSLLRDDYAG